MNILTEILPSRKKLAVRMTLDYVILYAIFNEVVKGVYEVTKVPAKKISIV